jgi:hypothetical protein
MYFTLKMDFHNVPLLLHLSVFSPNYSEENDVDDGLVGVWARQGTKPKLSPWLQMLPFFLYTIMNFFHNLICPTT